MIPCLRPTGVAQILFAYSRWKTVVPPIKIQKLLVTRTMAVNVLFDTQAACMALVGFANPKMRPQGIYVLGRLQSRVVASGRALTARDASMALSAICFMEATPSRELLKLVATLAPEWQDEVRVIIVLGL